MNVHLQDNCWNTDAIPPSNRRNFVRTATGISLGTLLAPHGILNDSDIVKNDIQLKYEDILNQSHKNVRQPQLWNKTLRNHDEINFLLNYGKLLVLLSRNLNIDPSLMSRLVVMESRGIVTHGSKYWPHGLMQMIPATVRDFSNHFFDYQPHFLNISPDILNYLQSDVALRVMIKWFETSSDANWWKKVVRNMSAFIENPELNLILGHVYFAKLRHALEPVIHRHQSEISQYFSLLKPDQYQEIHAARMAIGTNPLSMEFFRYKYSHRISIDSAFALDTETLIRYNGGNNRPKKSYRYAAVIQA